MKAFLILAFILILFFSTWFGYRKGLIKGVGSLLILVIAMYGANLLSETYAFEIIDALRPFASGYIETTINSKVRTQMGIASTDANALSIEDFLTEEPDKAKELCELTYENMGLYEKTASQLADEAISYASVQDVALEDSLTLILCQRICYVGVFIVAFLLILIALETLRNIPNLSFKIPGMDLLNDIGGLALGLIQGLFFCSMIAWMLKFTGLIIPQSMLSGCKIVSAFMKMDLIGHFLGI